MSRPRVALFDVDRTLVRKDTATLLAQYQRDTGQTDWRHTARVAYWVVQYTFGVANAQKIAADVLGDYRGTPEAQLVQDGQACFEAYISEHISPTAREVVRRHQQAGDFVAIVTSATRFTTEPIARALGIETWLCSELEVDDGGALTGRLSAELCYGIGKVRRVQDLCRERELPLDDAWFYSDSITDLPLLSLVGCPVVVNPDLRLRRVAQARGWPVERW